MANTRDNAQQKFVRALANLNTKLVTPGSGDEITVNLKANGGDGGGVVTLQYGGPFAQAVPLFTAYSTEVLNEFLDADPLAQLVLVATQTA